MGIGLLFLFLSLQSSGNQPAVHPFYVSVTEINHNAQDKNLEISCKIFTDDFEKALSKMNNVPVDLFTPKDKAKTEKMIADYIRKHLVIKLNDKASNLQFVGYEREEEAIWSYFEVPGTLAPGKVEVENHILYDSFDLQINLMHVSVKGARKSIRLDYPKSYAKFEF